MMSKSSKTTLHISDRTSTRDLLRADEVRILTFPRDHGRHSEYRTEWWYLSGQLRSEDGSEWGYQFTIFRRALERWRDLAVLSLGTCSRSIRRLKTFQRSVAEMLERQNCRRINVDGYVGHLAITNIKERRFVFFQSGGSSLFNIAHARDDCLSVRLKSWILEEDSGSIRAIAERQGSAIALNLVPLKPPVVHGLNGLARKGQDAGQASYHYSLTSLETSGTLKWRGTELRVTGTSWMDREFGTSMFPKSLRGWDWFGLTFDNKVEIMLSLIRELDGTISRTSTGTLIRPDGTSRLLGFDDFHVAITDQWESPLTGACYPVQWTVAVNSIDSRFTIRARIREHELISGTSTTINYWEGPVDISGTMDDRAVTGRGHVELVGYCEPAGGKF
ncbi:MAG: lipocalin-like domain-containing protein [Desulfomonilaceae bacterium]|nr:lipocalin-like domain-containing protein [Desulfomonilaceae bacterium]